MRVCVVFLWLLDSKSLILIAVTLAGNEVYI